MLRLVLSFLLLSTISTEKEDLYLTLSSDVLLIGKQNWVTRVDKGRHNGNIILIHFYEPGDEHSYEFSLAFKEKAKELKGIYIFGFVNCKKERALCDKEVPNSLPVLKLYPPLPFPSEEFNLDFSKAIAKASTFIKSYVTEVNSDTIAGFVAQDPALPKVLFFTDKKGIPMIYNALSNAFKDKLRFSIIRNSESELVRTYGIKKFPAFRVLKTGTKKPFVFEKEPNYPNLFDFLNVFSEQYAPTDKDSQGDVKVWMFESIPELTQKSGKEICFDLEKTLCVILFSKGKPSPQDMEAMKSAKQNFENNLDRSFVFKFMWIDSSKHNHWLKDLEVDDSGALTVRVLNPGRRKRFMKMEGDFSEKELMKTLEKIIGGDARFANLKEAQLPEFSADL